MPLLATSYLVLALSNFLLTITVGRVLGAATLGIFALAVATARLLFAAADFGVVSHLGRSVARERARAAQLASLFVTFRATMIPVAIVVGVGASFAFAAHAPLVFALVALAVGMTNVQVLYEQLALAHERQRVAAVLTMCSAMCVAGGCGLWFLLRAKLITFALIYAIAAATGLATWIFWTAKRLAISPRWLRDRVRLLSELKVSWPIGASILLGLAALRSPVLVLGMFVGDHDVGTFAAADMFVTAAGIFQAAISNATFPRLAATYRNDPPAFRAAFLRSNLALAAFGIALGTGLALFGGTVVRHVFPSKDFVRLSALMPIVGWSAPALLLAHHNILVFAAADSERRNLRLMLAWFVVIAGFQLLLVPLFGLMGAAWGLLVGRMVGLGILAVAVFASGIHRGGSTTR